MTFDKSMLARYFVLGTQNVANEAEFFNILEQALVSGITLFQFREKGQHALTGNDKLRVAQQVRQLTTKYRVPLVIDDDIALAHVVNADGVHFGQGDGNISENIKASAPLFVGVSVSNQAEYDRIAGLRGIDNIGIGPVYETTTKSDASPTIGIAGLNKIVNQSQWPSVAIGGITQKNLPDVLATNVDGAAVVSMITQSKNISETINIWKQL